MENASKALIIAGAILISILLITIGIVLINSGRNITTQGTSQMESQKIQTFNAQFTPYEGIISGAQVRALLATVRASNATDKAHQVALYYYLSTDVVNSKQYKIILHYYPGERDAFWHYDVAANNFEENSEIGYVYDIEVQEFND